MLPHDIAGGTGPLGIYFFSWHAAIMRPSGLAVQKVRSLGR